MSDANSDGLPRRDAGGRVVALPDLLGITLAGLVIGVLMLVVFDWAAALVGLGAFGRTNGWLAVILPVWLFVEEFRAWGPGPARVVAALVAAAVGIVVGLLAAGAAAGLAPIWTGAIAAAVFALSYAMIWFFGVRWVGRRTG
jgi:hypothetical protein